MRRIAVGNVSPCGRRAECDLVVPGPIWQIVDAWRASGSPSQEGIAWRREHSVAAFPPVRRRSLRSRTGSIAPPSAVPASTQRSVRTMPNAHSSRLWRGGTDGWDTARSGSNVCSLRRRTLAANSRPRPTQQAQGRPIEAYGRLGDHGTARLPRLGPRSAPSSCTSAPPTGARRPSSSTALWRAGSVRTSAWRSTNSGGVSPPTRATWRPCSAGPASSLSAADELEFCIFSDAGWARREPMGSPLIRRCRTTPPPARRRSTFVAGHHVREARDTLPIRG